MKPVTDKAYKLLHEGSIALSQVEANGMRIDTDYLNRAIIRTTKKIKELSSKMKEDKVFKLWRKTYGTKTNLGSHQQLGKIIFSVMKYECPSYTKTGRPKTDINALEVVDLPFVRKFLKVERLKKANSTYLKGILRETTNGFLHPFFHLHFARTYRGSSSNPNFQNIPIKNPVIKKLVRRAFIARPNHQIVEVDYSGIEICGATCYHKDPTMIEYIETGPGQLHTDMAGEIYILKRKEISWDARDTSKNMFVFPQFYGDYYIHCAMNMWKAIIQRSIKTNDGLSLIKHLKRKGITKLGACDPEEEPLEGTFEQHLKDIENDFWNEKFPVYNQWKKDWYKQYLKKGYFNTLTGFRIEGLLNRKQVINYPIQGTAFHWLLWSLIRIQKLLKKYRMRSLLVGQIHDSIVGDIHRKEKRNYLEIVKQVIHKDIRKHWKWIIVSLVVEAEVAPIGGSWYDKQEVEI